MSLETIVIVVIIVVIVLFVLGYLGPARELWIESLGMPAVLPPPEEEKKVTTAIGAARVWNRSRRRCPPTTDQTNGL